MAKRIFSLKERKAFKRGMACQYNKEHPKYHYAVAEKHTSFNEDGSVLGTPYYGKVSLFKTKREAERVVADSNKLNRLSNAHVLEAVKKKKVNVYNSYDSSVRWAEMKHIKPTRGTQYCDFEELKAAKNNRPK